MSRADERTGADSQPARRRFEAVIAQYIRELAAEAGGAGR